MPKPAMNRFAIEFDDRFFYRKNGSYTKLLTGSKNIDILFTV